MDDGQVRLEVGIAQIFEVFPQLGGRQQSLKQRYRSAEMSGTR